MGGGNAGEMVGWAESTGTNQVLQTYRYYELRQGEMKGFIDGGICGGTYGRGNRAMTSPGGPIALIHPMLLWNHLKPTDGTLTITSAVTVLCMASFN